MDHEVHTSAAEQSSRFYRLTCGMPVVLDPAMGRILLTTGRIVGIAMPGDRGEAVVKEMKDHGFPLGPIVCNGVNIALPASRIDQFRHWVEEPRDTFRPAGSAVVDSIRRTVRPGVCNVS